MQAMRQRAICLVRRSHPATVRKTRSYASGAHHEHHQPHAPVNESMGVWFYVTMGALPASLVLYNLSRSGKDGEEPALTRWLHSFWYMQEQWEQRNTLHDKAVQQASFDRTLFLHSAGVRHVDLKTPELLQSYSPMNVSPGSTVDMTKIAEHYHKQHLEEEERKAKKLQAAKRSN